MRFAVLVLIGPGAREEERLANLLESLWHFESAVSELVLVDDATPQRSFSSLPHPPDCRVVVLPNPRKGEGDGWTGGLAAAMLAGLGWIAKNSACDFALKLDTDALVIAPFSAQIAEGFCAHKEAFLLGTCTKTPNRKYDLPEDFSTAPALKKLQRVFTVWRRTWRPWPRAQCTLFGRDRVRARLIRAAVRHGYRLGMHCQGGAYAVSAGGLRELDKRGIFDDPLLWIWTPCSEDIALTVSVFACGGQAVDLNGDGEPFGVVSRGLPDTLERVVERGFSILHSVKDFEGWNEAETRAFFRRQRDLQRVR